MEKLAASVRGTQCVARGARYEVHGARYEVRSAWRANGGAKPRMRSKGGEQCDDLLSVRAL